MSRAGIYCKPENVDRHLMLESDGMVYCQHCYRELQAENERLKTIIKEVIKRTYDVQTREELKKALEKL